MEGSGPGRPYKPPELSVRSILGDYALQHEAPELNVRTEIRNLSKFRASRKGRIRVNKEVLVILKQVSSELDAAQRHYLAYKQFGDAGESILKLSPELFFLPSDGAAEAGTADDDQDGAAADTAAAGGAATSGTGGQNLPVGQRRWGYFPLLNKLKPVSVKRKPPPAPQQQARSSNGDVAAPAAEAAAEPEDWAEPDSPKASWAELMHQKKRAKEDGIAHMVRVRHAVLVIQRAWRKHLQKRASKALAMMMLRAKVRRAHRAAYVSNLLRRRTPGISSSSGGEATGEGGSSLEGAADEEDIQLTPQQETELQEALQRVLEEGKINMQDLAELQLTELMDRLNCKRGDSPAGSSITLATGSRESSSEPEDEAEEQQQGGWKSISTPKAPVKQPMLLRVDTGTAAGSDWQGSLRTPGGSLRTNSRIGTPEIDPTCRGNSSSGSRRQSGLGSPSECSPHSSNESGSPGTPACFGGPDSPKRASMSRSSLRSAGGVKVGKRMSVVLADAENAVAIAHGSGNVVVRAKSAARQGHHNISRLNPAAGTRTSAMTDTEHGSLPVDGHSGSNVDATATAESEQQLLLPNTAGTRSSIRRSSMGNHTPTAAAAGDLGYPISSRRTSRASFNDEIDYLGKHKVETALHAAAGGLTSGAVAAAVAAGFAAAAAGGSADVCGDSNGGSNAEQHPTSVAEQQLQQLLARQWQEQCGTPIPDGLMQSLAAAAAQAGLQTGSQEWQQAMQQMQQHAVQQVKQQQQQQVAGQQQQGLAGNSINTSAATGLHTGVPGGQHSGMATAVVDAAATAVAAITAVLGSGNNIPTLAGASQASHSANSGPQGGSSYGCTSSHEPTAGAVPAAAGLPHYASPLPPRSSSPGRRYSCTAPEDGHRVDDGTLSCDGSWPSGTAVSRRASREGGAPVSRGFVTTASSGAAFSKYERGLGDGLQQDYRVIAAEALLADGRGPAAPLHPRRHSKVQSSDGYSRQSPVGERSGEGRPRTRLSREGLAKADEQHQNEEEEQQQQQQQQQQLLLDMLEQQQQLVAARGLVDLGSFDGPVGFSFAGDDQSQQRQVQQYKCDAEFDPVAAAAAVAASIEQYNAAAAAAATAAAGQSSPLMQGLVLSQGGVWQQQGQQQQLRADGWYERLMARKKNVRQPWDLPADANGNVQQQQGDGDGAGKGLAGQERSARQEIQNPTGLWGRRGKVHNAWLFVDGRQAAALPWQALAAAAAAGSGADSSTAAASARSVESAALDAAVAFMEPNAAHGANSLKQLSVQGKKLLIKLMWMKSAARVLRSLGRDTGLSQVLERNVLTAIRNNTCPAGKQLLVWSVEDQQQQEQQQQRQQQQQLMLCMQLQQQLLMQQRLGMLNPSLGLSAAGSLQHTYQLSGWRMGLNPLPSNCPQQLGLAGEVLGQHLPLLPAARARSLLSKSLPAGQQLLQHQQLLWILAQQQQQLMLLQQQQQPGKLGVVPAAQYQQLMEAVAAAAAPAMGDQQHSDWSPLQMQQLLQVQQRLLEQHTWQQQQQQVQQVGGEGAQELPAVQYSMTSASSMDEFPLVKKLVLATRVSRTGVLATGTGSVAAASAGTTAAAAAAAKTGGVAGGRQQDSAAVPNDVKQAAACKAGDAHGGRGTFATSTCISGSSAADVHTEDSGGGSSSAHLPPQQKDEEQQQQQIQWLQPPSATALPQPAGGLQVLGALKQQQQQQGQQAKQVGQQSLSASWPSAAWQDASKASAVQGGGLQQQQQCNAFSIAQQQQQQGAKAVSFQLLQQAGATSSMAVADDSSSIPAGPTYLSFVTSTKFQPRMSGKPHRRRTDGGLLPSVASGSAGASSSAAAAIPNAANRQRCMRGSSNGAVGAAAATAAATADVHVQRVNLGYPKGSNVQGLPSLTCNAQQQQLLQLQYQQQQQQLRQGLVPGFSLQQQQQQQQQQQHRPLLNSAGSATGLQQQQHRAVSLELDSESVGEVFSGWSVEAARRRSSRLSTSDPGSSALLADMQTAAAAAAAAEAEATTAAGGNASSSSEKPRLQQAAVHGKKGHNKPVGVMQCIAQQANGTDGTTAVRRPKPAAADGGSAAATGARQQGCLHQMQPQLPQLAPLRLAVDQGLISSLRQAKSAELVAMGGAVHSKQVLPAIILGISTVQQH